MPRGLTVQSMSETKLLSIGEAAKRLGLKKATVYKYVGLRAVPFVKLGSRVLFDPIRLDAWVKAHAVEPKPGAKRALA